MRKMSWNLGQYFHNECFHELIVLNDVVHDSIVLNYQDNLFMNNIVSTSYSRSEQLQGFKSSMTTFVVCHYMVKILHKLAILNVRILNHWVANWKMIAILAFIFLTCSERFSPKQLLLVGRTVYLSQSRNHQEDVEKVTIILRKVQPLSIINVLLHSCNTQTEDHNTIVNHNCSASFL